MKTKLTLFSLVTFFVAFIGFDTYAQQYRTKTMYQEKHDGTKYVKSEDSMHFHFSGSQNWKPIYNMDYSNARLESFIASTLMGSELKVPVYPDRYSKTQFASDSVSYFPSNASGTDYGDKSRHVKISRDASGNITEELTRVYTGGSWQNQNRTTYTYNTSNKITQVVKQNWMSGSWNNSSKEVSVYDGNKLTEFTTFYWSSGAWTENTKNIYQYNSNGDCNVTINKNHSGSTWNNESKIEVEYDGNHRATQLIYFSWSASTWHDLQKLLITYNSSGKKKEILYQAKSGSSWNDELKVKYSYEDGLLTTYSSQNFVSSTWENLIKKTYTYTSTTKKIKTVTYADWNMGESDWKNKRKLNVEYNSDKEISNFYDETWNSGGYWEKNSTCKKYNFKYGSYGSTNVKDLTLQADCNVYPNPTATDLNVNIQWKNPQPFKVTIYDLNGRMMSTKDYEQATQSQILIHTQDFATGTYFLKIIAEEGQMTKQFQILK